MDGNGLCKGLAELGTDCEEKTCPVAGPYQDLYIYLLEGMVKKKEESYLGSAFIGNWVEEDTSFLFFSKPSADVLSQLLKMRPGLEVVEDYHFAYEQWQGGRLKPLKVDDFIIVPHWDRVEANEKEIQIILDPGVVFGNGLHPTTRDCLRALAFAGRQRPFDRVLDLGTGTGILAVAAALLGAKRVLAVDLNPLCVRTANENVRLNGLNGIIQGIEGRAEDFVNEAVDLVIANIHKEIIGRLLLKEGFRKKDRLIISGLMRSQYREIKAQLGRHDFHILREWDYDMTWFTMLVEKEKST
jgi:ribosomal protein L11 methyltransferase